MNSSNQFFIGIDVSKPFFDVALLPVINHQKGTIVTGHFDNTESGLKSFGKWLTTHKVGLDNTLVVPFSERSGISIKGRNKVHPMANKELKKMLHLCALSAIQHSAELKQYYERKKQEGKHSMSILNAIRNKIVLRAVAVINNQKKYVDFSKIAA